MDSTKTVTILVVEDDPGLLGLYKEWLKDSYDVTLVDTCESAYCYFNEQFDIALLDRELPDGTGDEILQSIRSDNLGWQVAMITGKNPSLDLLHLECNEYLEKPVTRTELLDTVERLSTQAKLGDLITEYNSLKRRTQLLEEFCPTADLQASSDYLSLKNRQERLHSQLASAENVLPPALEKNGQ